MGPRSRDHGVANVEAGMSLLGLQTYPRNRLKGKRVLWLDSLNQPQKTKLTIAMDLKRSHGLARTDARRIIWHVDEFYILSRTSLLLFLFHKG
ncbi:unnamed protein product, partial [Brassica oleracea]